MKPDDDMLMAYADGQLDAAAAADVEAAVAADAALAARVAEHRALRQRLQSAFPLDAEEALPEAWLQRLPQAPAAAAPVADLAAARARRRPSDAARRGWGWLEWGGMAAGLAIGLLVGGAVERAGIAASPGGEAAMLARSEGGWVADGALERALDSQLAGAPPQGAPVALPLSFVARDGRYCRSFALAAAAGLACREGGRWQLELVARRSEGPAPGGGLRQASTALPAEVLAAVQARIEGDALDAAAERAARDAGWRR